jgi:hypothetical protein
LGKGASLMNYLAALIVNNLRGNPTANFDIPVVCKVVDDLINLI